ncbi:MAG: ketoacyl-ACP synthase III [Bacteroidetes bacterium QH_2_63_10]|nr:MAG: ketoacyl-ACP synthase III [Bacteroidetes bacterium QH_2_63_10]
MRRATIAGTGYYAPEEVVPNSYFDELYGEDVDSFLRENRNIEERRYAAEEQATSDLAAAAARDAMGDAGVTPADVDLLLVSTDTPDQISPSTAAVVQDKLDARNAATFDINTACAGFVTALDTGRKFLEADRQYEHVLVIGAYLMSRFIDYDQKNVASLFADGAGAAVLAPTSGDDGILTSTLVSKGEYHDYMGVYEGGTACPITAENGETQRLAFRKDFPDEFNPDHWTDLVTTLTDRLDVTPQDVDQYFFTQINILSIRVAMALADAVDKDLLSPGDLVVMIASGGGAALAGMAFRWDDA